MLSFILPLKITGFASGRKIIVSLRHRGTKFRDARESFAFALTLTLNVGYLSKKIKIGGIKTLRKKLPRVFNLHDKLRGSVKNGNGFRC